MEQAITVTPIADGWKLDCALCDREQLYRSGADAEAGAHNLATEIAASGATAVIQIFLRDGTLGGRYVHAPRARGRAPDVRRGSAPASPPESRK